MPELPDLTVFAENLNKAVAGKPITSAGYHREKRLNVSAQELARALVPAKIEKVERHGKRICLRMSNKALLCLHLMLNGGFVLTTAAEVEALPGLILSICFQDGSALAVTDPKGLVTVALNPQAEREVPDALAVTADYLQAAFKKQPKMLVKPFLINQEIIGGIGNAYSDEILWRAGISPKSAVGKLPPDAVAALAESIRVVLLDATEQIRSKHPGIVSGEVRDFLKVHGSKLKKSPTGAPIIREQIQTKTTYYTEEQTLYK